jgi:hypothetical protein
VGYPARRDGHYLGENSCKVYQATYSTAPALFALLGTRWQEHFVPRHDLAREWMRPFVRESRKRDLAKIVLAWARHGVGVGDDARLSVGEWMEREGVEGRCRDWMRATALGGIAGTLRMPMAELFHRLRGNLGSIVHGGGGTLYWNAQPPDGEGGFVSRWITALLQAGVSLRTGVEVESVVLPTQDGGHLGIQEKGGPRWPARAALLAVPPRGLSTLMLGSPPSLAGGFGGEPALLAARILESRYEHLGISWFFDEPFPHELPLGGHNVRRGWHPILVQHDQYRTRLRPPAVTTVVGSLSVETDFRHPIHGTRAANHEPDELARILWEDERRADPALPPLRGHHVYGMSDATQITVHGPLPVRHRTAPVFVATHMNGLAPYRTASLEAAIQAGAAAAAAFDPGVERLPTGSPGWRWSTPLRLS